MCSHQPSLDVFEVRLAASAVDAWGKPCSAPWPRLLSMLCAVQVLRAFKAVLAPLGLALRQPLTPAQLALWLPRRLTSCCCCSGEAPPSTTAPPPPSSPTSKASGKAGRAPAARHFSRHCSNTSSVSGMLRSGREGALPACCCHPWSSSCRMLLPPPAAVCPQSRQGSTRLPGCWRSPLQRQRGSPVPTLHWPSRTASLQGRRRRCWSSAGGRGGYGGQLC